MRAFPKSVKRLAPFWMYLLLASCLSAATLVQLSLTDLIRQSTTIEHATVLSSWAAASGRVVYTHYKVQISEQMKGPAISEIVVLGGAANGMVQAFAGAPQLNPGEDYVFFLYTNQAARTYVTGLTQGLFRVNVDGTANPGLTRNASRERVLDPKTGRQVLDQTLSMKLADLRTQIASVLATAKGGQ